MKTTKKRKKIDFSAYLFILPVSVFFITFVLVPMLRGLQLSLYSFAKKNPVFVGLKHYSDLLFSGNGATIHEPFMKSLINTVVVTVVAVPIVVLVSIFVAVTIYNKSAVVRSFFRGVFYIPAISSVVSVTVVWAWIYHPEYGILNYVFKSMHIINENVDWLGNPKTAYMLLLRF